MSTDFPALPAARKLDEHRLANGIARYTTGSTSYWTGVQPTRSFSTHHDVGVEAIFHGYDD
jgi:hypothetical protein